jgi:hypothetical protein
MENRLVEQISETSKGLEFEQWWINEYSNLPYIIFNGWLQLPIEFQKGVFEKYVLSKNLYVSQEVTSKDYTETSIPPQTKNITKIKYNLVKEGDGAGFRTKDGDFFLCGYNQKVKYVFKESFNSFEELLLNYFKQE